MRGMCVCSVVVRYCMVVQVCVVVVVAESGVCEFSPPKKKPVLDPDWDPQSEWMSKTSI